MPRGQSKPSPHSDSAFLFAPLKGDGRISGPARAPEDSKLAIARSVNQFIDAWFLGDSVGMVRCLHPDYVHRLVSIDGRGEPPGELIRQAVGVQGQFGALTPLERRRQEVRILDVRANSASAVADMGDWILQIHLARSGGQWHIVNAMWELNASFA